jgi:hypothetical protein
MASLRGVLGALLGITSVSRAVILKSAKDTPVPPVYAIGQVNESFAKPAGLLFDVNGKVEYFSGELRAGRRLRVKGSWLTGKAAMRGGWAI